MGRAPCCDKANVKKGPWSPEEDAKLKEFIEKNGPGGNWIALPQKAGLKRCGKSCRLRWLNYLRPNIKHGDFSEEEDRIICSLYASIGSRWSIIAAQLSGRTDNDIKNYWNTKLKKKAMTMGIITSQSNSFSHQQAGFSYVVQTSSSSPPQLSHLSASPSSSSLSYNYSSSSNRSNPARKFTGLEPAVSYSCATAGSIFQPQENFLSPMFMVGGEASCSSDGNNSATDDFQNYMYTNEVEENKKFTLGDVHGIWGDNSLDCGLEDIKQLITSTNNSYNSFLFDEHKIEEKVMYY